MQATKDDIVTKAVELIEKSELYNETGLDMGVKRRAQELTTAVKEYVSIAS